MSTLTARHAAILAAHQERQLELVLALQASRAAVRTMLVALRQDYRARLAAIREVAR